MASIKNIAAGRKEYFLVDPSLIQVDPDLNVRQEGPAREARIAEMMSMIAAQGLLSPITVRLKGETMLVVSGHTRLEAIRRLNANNPTTPTYVTVPCLVERAGTTDAERSLTLLTENEGQPLNQVEKADLFKRMNVLYGYTEEMIAQQAGIGLKQVQNLLTLALASTEVKEMISSGQVSATTATKIIAKEGSEAATVTLTAAVEDAVAQGRAKATTKSISVAKAKVKAPASTPAPVNFVSDLLGIAPEVTATPAVVAYRPSVPATGLLSQVVQVMEECLNIMDVATIHLMVGEMLDIVKNKKTT